LDLTVYVDRPSGINDLTARAVKIDRFSVWAAGNRTAAGSQFVTGCSVHQARNGVIAEPVSAVDPPPETHAGFPSMPHEFPALEKEIEIEFNR